MDIRRTIASAAAILALSLAPAVQAKTLTIGLGTEPTSIDPHFHNLGPNNQIAQHFFSRLVEQDHKQNLSPGLATSWKALNELTWEFKLRKGVKFHDGSDFNADDVVFSFNRAGNHPNARSSFGLFTKGKKIKVIDNHTIQISTAKPFPLMVVDVSNVHIVSSNEKDKWEGEYNNGNSAYGTGPYKLVKWVKGEVLEMERNENYHGTQPYWKKIVMKPIKSPPSRLAALLAGDVDFIDQVPTVDIAGLKKKAKVQLSQGVSNRIIYLHMDQFRDNPEFVKTHDGKPVTKNPFKDVRVRKAVNMAINRAAIVERVMEGVAIPAGQLLPEGFFGRSSNLPVPKYDPAGAKKLLAEAGYPKGFQVTLHGPNDRYINDAKIVEAIAQMLTRIGIKTTPDTMPKSVFFKHGKNGGPAKPPKWNFLLVGWGSSTGEPSNPLRSLLGTYDKTKGWGSSNRGLHSDSEMDKVLEEALSTVDDKKRAALLAKATEIGIGRNKGIITLHYQVNTWAGKKGLSYKARTDERTVGYDVSP